MGSADFHGFRENKIMSSIYFIMYSSEEPPGPMAESVYFNLGNFKVSYTLHIQSALETKLLST